MRGSQVSPHLQEEIPYPILENVRKATDHAARAVIAMLSQPSPVIAP